VKTIIRAVTVVLVAVLSAACLTSGNNGLPVGRITLQALPVSAGHHVRNANGTSTNWSGYIAASTLTAPPAGSVSDVKGTWVVPTATGVGSTAAYSAAWVGLDGYSDSTVEQIGTDSDWTRRGASYYAWIEIYPQGAYLINGFPVIPGDTISAEVNYAGNNEFALILTNVTRRLRFSMNMRAPAAKRESAEWIMEAPSSNKGVLPLTDFHAINFLGCTATIFGQSGPINDLRWQNDLFNIETAAGVKKDQVSVLSANGENFSVTWEHQ
jgi:hypothetical protein